MEKVEILKFVIWKIFEEYYFIEMVEVENFVN